MVTVAKVLRENYNGNVEINVSGNYRLGDIRHNFADITNIKTKLGFEPKYNFDQGISEFVKWVNKQEIEADNYIKSIEELKKKGLYK